MATKKQTGFEIGDRVEGGRPGTEDYDAGEVIAVDGDQVTVAWDSLVQTTQSESRLRAEGAQVAATIVEAGNGFPDVGDYVPGDDGELYRVVTRGRNITTHGPGAGDQCHGYVLELADWSDAESDDEVHPCSARLDRACEHDRVDSDAYGVAFCRDCGEDLEDREVRS